LSHTGSLLGCAVACKVAVGLDCEVSSRHTRRDPLRLAYRYFHPSEIAALEGGYTSSSQQVGESEGGGSPRLGLVQ
jgi:phosphopantetheinyl transferase